MKRKIALLLAFVMLLSLAPGLVPGLDTTVEAGSIGTADRVGPVHTIPVEARRVVVARPETRDAWADVVNSFGQHPNYLNIAYRNVPSGTTSPGAVHLTGPAGVQFNGSYFLNHITFRASEFGTAGENVFSTTGARIYPDSGPTWADGYFGGGRHYQSLLADAAVMGDAGNFVLERAREVIAEISEVHPGSLAPGRVYWPQVRTAPAGGSVIGELLYFREISLDGSAPIAIGPGGQHLYAPGARMTVVMVRRGGNEGVGILAVSVEAENSNAVLDDAFIAMPIQYMTDRRPNRSGAIRFRYYNPRVRFNNFYITLATRQFTNIIGLPARAFTAPVMPHAHFDMTRPTARLGPIRILESNVGAFTGDIRALPYGNAGDPSVSTSPIRENRWRVELELLTAGFSWGGTPVVTFEHGVALGAGTATAPVTVLPAPPLAPGQFGVRTITFDVQLPPGINSLARFAESINIENLSLNTVGFAPPTGAVNVRVRILPPGPLTEPATRATEALATVPVPERADFANPALPTAQQGIRRFVPWGNLSGDWITVAPSLTVAQFGVVGQATVAVTTAVPDLVGGRTGWDMSDDTPSRVLFDENLHDYAANRASHRTATVTVSETAPEVLNLHFGPIHYTFGQDVSVLGVNVVSSSAGVVGENNVSVWTPAGRMTTVSETAYQVSIMNNTVTIQPRRVETGANANVPASIAVQFYLSVAPGTTGPIHVDVTSAAFTGTNLGTAPQRLVVANAVEPVVVSMVEGVRNVAVPAEGIGMFGPHAINEIRIAETAGVRLPVGNNEFRISLATDFHGLGGVGMDNLTLSVGNALAGGSFTITAPPRFVPAVPAGFAPQPVPAHWVITVSRDETDARGYLDIQHITVGGSAFLSPGMTVNIVIDSPDLMSNLSNNPTEVNANPGLFHEGLMTGPLSFPVFNLIPGDGAVGFPTPTPTPPTPTPTPNVPEMAVFGPDRNFDIIRDRVTGIPTGEAIQQVTTVVDGQVFVALRAVENTMRAFPATWDAALNSVTFTDNVNTVVFFLGSAFMNVNGVPTNMEINGVPVNPKVLYGRTMIPIEIMNQLPFDVSVIVIGDQVAIVPLPPSN